MERDTVKLVRVFLAVVVILGSGFSVKTQAEKVPDHAALICCDWPPCPPLCPVGATQK